MAAVSIAESERVNIPAGASMTMPSPVFISRVMVVLAWLGRSCSLAVKPSRSTGKDGSPVFQMIDLDQDDP